jgi:hypothetical protein
LFGLEPAGPGDLQILIISGATGGDRCRAADVGTQSGVASFDMVTLPDPDTARPVRSFTVNE